MNNGQAVGLSEAVATIAEQALANARAEKSFANYPAIIAGFIEKGIAPEEISPRENVLTYNAWLALGRQVRRGEHGVKVLTMVAAKGKPAEDGQGASKSFKFPRSVAVFHITQTDAVALEA